jgi:hypothetical protein
MTKKSRTAYRHKSTGKFVTHPKMAAPVKLAGVTAAIKSFGKISKRKSK